MRSAETAELMDYLKQCEIYPNDRHVFILHNREEIMEREWCVYERETGIRISAYPTLLDALAGKEE